MKNVQYVYLYRVYDHKSIHLHIENKKDNEFFANSLNQKNFINNLIIINKVIISFSTEIYFPYN